MSNEIALPSLTPDEFESNAKLKLLEVFNMPISFESPFAPKMVSRMIVYCEIHPPIELLEALVDIGTKFGEKGFYYSTVELIDDYLEYPGISRILKKQKTCFVPFEDISTYLDQYFVFEHVIYSSSGRWGIYMDDDDFLLMGGIQEFMNEIEIKFPNIDELLHKFFEDRKLKHRELNAYLDWIPKLLEHMYGSAESKRLLKENGMVDQI
jgi:hypothetical protein